MKARCSQVAGIFYPADADELAKQIDQLLSCAPSQCVPGRLKALIVPHAGYIYSGNIAAVGYKLLMHQAPAKDWHVLLMGPAHFAHFPGAATLPCDYWQTPLGLVRSSKLIPSIGRSGLVRDLPQAHQREHSLEVQLPFLQSVLRDFSIFPVLTGELNYRKLGHFLLAHIDKFDVVIVSSDLSHYHAYEEAIQLDAIAHRAITALDFATMEQRAEACGKMAILTLMQLAKEFGWKSSLLAYGNSGDVMGDRAIVVGYGCYAFFQ